MPNITLFHLEFVWMKECFKVMLCFKKIQIIILKIMEIYEIFYFS